MLKCCTVWRGLWNIAICLLEDEEQNGYGLKGEIDELQKYKKKKHMLINKCINKKKWSQEESTVRK